MASREVSRSLGQGTTDCIDRPIAMTQFEAKRELTIINFRYLAAVAFFGNISPIRRTCAPTPFNFSSMCS